MSQHPSAPSDDPLSGLRAPAGGHALLELSVRWPDLDETQARMAAALRVFIITRDPLDWLVERGSAWATANLDGDALELCVYVTHAAVGRRLAATGGDLAAAIAPLAEAAVLRAAHCEALLDAGDYPEQARSGEAPGLLVRPTGADPLGTPTVDVISDGWEPVGLGTVQDLVQDAFGPVDLDRSRVTLDPVDEPSDECPGCAGHSFGFPAELTDASERMCEPHQIKASTIAMERIRHARASNLAGWRAIGKGAARVSGEDEPLDSPVPERRAAPPGRNEPCPCGSGEKYKRCCGA